MKLLIWDKQDEFDLLKTDIQEYDGFDWSVRTHNLFITHNIAYVWELVKMSAKEVKALVGCGLKQFKDIERFVENNELEFGMDVEQFGFKKEEVWVA